MRQKISRSWWGLALLTVAACASSSGGASTETAPPAGERAAVDQPGLAIVEVTHNLASNSSTLTILIEPQAGIRASLGTIEPGETKRFTYNAPPGNYKLVVQGGISSQSFRLSNNEIATWNMQMNRVTPRAK
jgi:hypothetical protein